MTDLLFNLVSRRIVEMYSGVPRPDPPYRASCGECEATLGWTDDWDEMMAMEEDHWRIAHQPFVPRCWP